MRKNLLIFLSLLLFSTSALAVERVIKWGYSTTDIDGEFGMSSSTGGAIYIPAEVAQLYKGFTLKGVMAGLAADASSVTVFATKTLGGTNLASATKSNVGKGDNEIEFDAPYTIDGDAFYVGYTYSGSANALGCCNLKSQDGCWVNIGGSWQNYASQNKTLNIRTMIAGDSKELPNDAALLTLEEGAEVELGKTLTLTGRYISFSPNFTKKYTLLISIDGVEQKTVEISKINVGPNVENSFKVELDPFTSVGTHTVSITLTKFGTSDDAYAGNNTVTATVNVKQKIPVRRHVLETYTSLNCGWCPGAGVAMKRLYEKYPDNFIGIEVYGNNATSLYAPSYSEFAFDNTPISKLNRNYTVDSPTSTSGTITYINYLGLKSDVDVTVKGSIVPGTENQVEAVATAEFINSQSLANYRWAFAVTENDVCDKEYSQKNYYAGGSHGSMDGWENYGSYTTAVPPTHVARAIYDYNGVYGSFPSSVTAFEPVEYRKVLELPGNIADNTKLNIIALLFNTISGEIINACEAQITGGTSSIADVQDTASPNIAVANGSIIADGTLSVYTVNGEQVENANLKSGLYVVRVVKDGNTMTKKVLVK